MNLKGQRFGAWTVICEGDRSHRHHPRWWARCDCGTSRKVRQASLRSGASTSCGCRKSAATGDDLRQRFESKIIPITESGCWIIESSRDGMRYGTFWMAKESISAHRAAWIIYYGDIPSGLCVCHKCDVPGCVNPDHLFLGTYRDNRRDAMSKGRVDFPVGSESSNAKLDEDDVIRIRQLKANGESACAIAKEFGVSRSNVYAVVNGRSWGHVGGEVVER